MELAKRQTYRSMEQNRKPRNKPMPYGQLIYAKGSKNIHGERTDFQQIVWGKLDNHMQKNKTELPSYTIPKNYLKMDERFECNTRNHKTPGRKYKQ